MTDRAAIYLDYAAATPLDPAVLEAMEPYYSERFFNPSANYLSATEVRRDLEAARSSIAYWLGARSSELIFTAGGTEANNLAIHGVLRGYPGANIVVSSVEHESVLAAAHKYDCREVAAGADGSIDLLDLERKIDDQTVLVCVMYANNEIGTIQPLRNVTKVLAAKRSMRQSGLPLYLHSDACQASNYLDLQIARLGVDLLSLNGGKLYGPKQSGSLYVKAGVELRPLIDGGGQERNLRSGTENVAGAIGFAKALEVAQTMRHEELARLRELQQQFFHLVSGNIPAAVLNGSLKRRLPNNVHLTFTGHDNERLLIQLDEAGIMAAAGSACSASDEEPSHVLRAIGLDDAAAHSSLRFTMGRQTTTEMIERTVETLKTLIN